MVNLRWLVLTAILALPIFVGANHGANAGTLPADIDHAIKRATARADSKVLSATVVDAIAQNPQLLGEIIRTASRAAPAYSIVIARDAAAAFPAFATQIAAAASRSTPETTSTINAVTQLSSNSQGAAPARLTPATGGRRDNDAWSDWDVSLGLGLALQPTYEGDDEYEVAPEFLLDISWRDRAFLTTEKNRGLGLNLIRSRQVRAGTYLTLDWGREESDATRLAGTGDIEISPEVGIFGELYAGSWRFSADLVEGLNREGQDGTLITFAGEFGGRVNEQLTVSAEGSAAYGGENYMRTYFGVNPGQAATSGKAVFFPEAGFKDITGAVNFHYVISDHWFGTTRAEWKRLIGDAAVSPLVDPDSENQVSATFVAGYRF